MDDDEELRSQCFGGDNPPSSFDQPMMKRFSSIENVDGAMRIFYFMREFHWINQIRLIISRKTYLNYNYVCQLNFFFSLNLFFFVC